MVADERAESFIPLAETLSYILAALLDGPKYGYVIAKFIEARSEGTAQIAIGNLYVSLKRLADQGLIEQDPTAQENERRKTKTYRLTGLGARVANLEYARIQRLHAVHMAARGRQCEPQGGIS